MQMQGTAPSLKRTLSLAELTLYGLGTTIGAGIYALVGVVAGQAGTFAPVSFMLAAVLAGFSALTFSELASRFPKSAGEAVYVQEGTGLRALALMTGLLVALAGTVSAAALMNGFAGYAHAFAGLPEPVLIAAMTVLLGLLAAWGIRESVWAAGVITLVEIAGLLVVVWSGREGFLAALGRPGDFLLPPFDIAAWGGIFVGGVLAFYAFLGFEDMVNIAEEVENAPRMLPRGILLTLGVTTVIYLAVSLTAVALVSPAELALSGAPLKLVMERGSGLSPELIGIIGMFAIAQGALIQIIMVARVLYGLSAEGHLHRHLSKVHPVRQTPLLATGLVSVAVLVLALWYDLAALAGVTSLVALTIFSLVNFSLLRIKWKERHAPARFDVRTYPAWVPAAGLAASVATLCFELARRLAF